MNILITGANGQLGNEMRVASAAHPKHRYFFTDVVEADDVHVLDITDAKAVKAFVEANGIDLIVNCAAYTNVDKAEDDEVIAKKINAANTIYGADIAEMQMKQDEIWELAKEILARLSTIQ